MEVKSFAWTLDEWRALLTVQGVEEVTKLQQCNRQQINEYLHDLFAKMDPYLLKLLLCDRKSARAICTLAYAIPQRVTWDLPLPVVLTGIRRLAPYARGSALIAAWAIRMRALLRTFEYAANLRKQATPSSNEYTDLWQQYDVGLCTVVRNDDPWAPQTCNYRAIEKIQGRGVCRKHRFLCNQTAEALLADGLKCKPVALLVTTYM
jgi:hypothetical protein